MPYSVIFIDRCNTRKNIPGFSKNFSFAAFPFFGEYSLLDFALFNTGIKDSSILLKRECKKYFVPAAQKWTNINLSYDFSDTDYDSFFSFIEHKEENILFYSADFAGLISNPEGLIELGENAKEGIVKFTIDRTPVDVYYAKRSRITELLKKFGQKCWDSENGLSLFLDEILTSSIDIIADIPGEIYFSNTLTEIYNSNMSLLKNENFAAFKSFFSSIPDPQEKNSIITSSGKVINSIISSNVKIEGYVENSIIFPEVKIKPSAEIYDSVIMNGNIIGKESVINKSLIFPWLKETSGIYTNIADNVTIGKASSSASNIQFPEQVNSGITFIGHNPSIPKNCIIEPGTLIGADVPASDLSVSKKMKKGSTRLQCTLKI